MRGISRGDADVTIRNVQVNAKLFFEDSKKEVQNLAEGFDHGGECGGQETVYFTDFGSGETFRGLDTFRKGPNGMEMIMLPNSIATIGLMRTVSK
jgi:hypothetical protein